jgi:catechol 2,3-dioxygenase-like lactoylglutathione lyase family enzyme
MIKKIGHITILVKDQDDALRFYTEKLGFNKRQDTTFGEDMCWVTVSPRDQPDLEITFVKAVTKEKLKALGKQAGEARACFSNNWNRQLPGGLRDNESKGSKVPRSTREATGRDRSGFRRPLRQLVRSSATCQPLKRAR